MSKQKNKKTGSERKRERRAKHRTENLYLRNLRRWWDRWWYEKNPVMRFVVLFGVLIGLFYLVTYVPYYIFHVHPAIVRFNAEASSAVLNLCGQGTTAVGEYISSSQFSISVHRGCDAIEPNALFVAAVLSYPARFSPKIPGILIGTLFLQVVNQLRIVSLFLTGVYYRKAFEVMHADVWQVIFILLAIVSWAFWIVWATRDREEGSTNEMMGSN